MNSECKICTKESNARSNVSKVNFFYDQSFKKTQSNLSHIRTVFPRIKRTIEKHEIDSIIRTNNRNNPKVQTRTEVNNNRSAGAFRPICTTNSTFFRNVGKQNNMYK